MRSLIVDDSERKFPDHSAITSITTNKDIVPDETLDKFTKYREKINKMMHNLLEGGEITLFVEWLHDVSNQELLLMSDSRWMHAIGEGGERIEIRHIVLENADRDMSLRIRLKKNANNFLEGEIE